MLHARALVLFLLLCTCTAARLHAEDSPGHLLVEMNLARAQPRFYAGLLRAQTAGRRATAAEREALAFLDRTPPLPPLSLSEGMSAGASLQVAQQGPTGARGHRGSDQSLPWDRIGRYGTWGGGVGENIFYGRSNARAIIMALIVDEKVRGRGHRKNIFNRAYTITGIASGSHAVYGKMWVFDFAGSYAEAGALPRNRSVVTAGLALSAPGF